MAEKLGTEHPPTETMTYITTTGLRLWDRMRLAVAIVLTPITLVLIGRSIRVTYRAER